LVIIPDALSLQAGFIFYLSSVINQTPVMKKYLVLALLLYNIHFSVFAQDLSYYLPNNVTYNPAIPTPKQIIFHEVGEYHITHDRLVNYLKAVAAASDRVKLETMGFTYENRPQLLLIITSPGNHQRLEEIRQQHVLLTDPSRSSSLNIEDMPVVVWIGHSIHGNEASGSNASLLEAYYLTAAQGKEIDELLDNTIILFDPSFNPDGLQRFSTWVNQHKSKNLVTDPNSREFNEVWPGGRFNHYWFDINRDWLPAVHPESQHRLEWFHKWKPNILTDHHEQGSNATFFFQPGVPSRVNPLTPDRNQELTALLGKFHAKALDKLGSLYFTKENYDDFYYGKGSTYPDINGCIGILFEQASSRGHAQETNNGLLTFPFTIRNQFTTALSTLEGAKALRKDFLEWQRTFYKDVMAQQHTVAGYVFGDKNDPEKTNIFLQLLMRHKIEIHELSDSYSSKDFTKGFAYGVSLKQPQATLVKAIFENIPVYKDSLFYDITAWNLPLAFGLPYQAIAVSATNNVFGKKLVSLPLISVGLTGGKSVSGYLINWNSYYAPAALYELLSNAVNAKVVTSPFEMEVAGRKRKFDYGTIIVPVSMQAKSGDEIYNIVQSVAGKYKLEAWSMPTSHASSGSDPGSNKMPALTKPSIAMIVGAGVNATDAGEVWHLLDQRMNIPASHLEQTMFNRADISKYNTIIMVGGQYNELNKDKLKTWVQAGGTLILTEEAVAWASQNGITNVKLKTAKSPVDSSQRLSYVQREQMDGAQQMNGSILSADADLAHPLAYGYQTKTVSLFKSNKVFPEKSKNPYATPFYYGNNPLQSGWMSRQNLEAVKNAAAVIVNTVGNGRVINIADNPNFRAFWLGGTKLFMNAIFFGRIIDAASARTED
jgi:hypothetical protein